MRRLIVPVAIVVLVAQLVAQSALAAFYDGNTLVTKWREYKKQEAGVKYDTIDAYWYMGYVSGVADAMGGIAYNKRNNTTVGQVCAIVGKWLDDNPSEWGNAADVLVTRALVSAFGKK